MGSSSSSSDQETTLRFAPYLEEKHSSALELSFSTGAAVIDNSPFASYDPPSADDAFFGVGFMLTSFPGMYDSFGKFMAGLDLDSLFTQTFIDKVLNADDPVPTEVAILEDAIEQGQEQKILARSLNASTGSTFVVSQANIEQSRVKRIAELRLTIRYGLVAGAVKAWNDTLRWQDDLVTRYAESLKDYYLCRINANDFGYKMNSNSALWPFNVLGFEMDMLASMRGSRAIRTMTERERSKVSKGLLVASYTWSGAQIGSYFPPYGTIIGAVVGFVVGVAIMLLE